MSHEYTILAEGMIVCGGSLPLPMTIPQNIMKRSIDGINTPTFEDGSEADPSVHGVNPTTGFYFESDAISASVNGTKRMRIDDNGVTIPDRLQTPQVTSDTVVLWLGIDTVPFNIGVLDNRLDFNQLTRSRISATDLTINVADTFDVRDAVDSTVYYSVDSSQSTHNVDSLYASGKGLVFDDAPMPNPLNYYANGLVSLDLTGPWIGTKPAILSYERIGSTVTLCMPIVVALTDGIAAPIVSTALPSYLTPNGGVTRDKLQRVVNLGVNAVGLIFISGVSGFVSWYKDVAQSNFDADGVNSAGFGYHTITYCL